LILLRLVDSLPRAWGKHHGVHQHYGGVGWQTTGVTQGKLSRMAVLWNPQNPGNAQQWKESQLPPRELGLHLHSMEVSSADKYEGAFKEATKARSGAVAVTQNPLASSNRKQIADLAGKHRLPTIYQRADFVERDGMMSPTDPTGMNLSSVSR